jgi:hypothetical protein
MTDGVLDVKNSPSYGKLPARRNAEAMRRLTQQWLPTARDRDTQIWPLGFGADVSKPRLEEFAKGGAGASTRCPTSRQSRPHAAVVVDTGQVIHSLVAALGGARCGQVGPPDRGQVERDKTTQLTVKIPPIATDGAITVVKSHPRFRVDFFTPKGVAAPSNGTLSDGESFERSGQSGRVESLRIGDPLPGVWKIKVSDPLGRASHAGVSAFAVWEGALQASLVVSPLLAIPGKKETVEVRVLGRDGGVITGAALKSLRAEARARAAFGPLDVLLKLDERRGVFVGTFDVPADAADGSIDVAARVSGSGIASDRRTDSVTIDHTRTIYPTFKLDPPPEVHPGEAIDGTLTIDNQGAAIPGALAIGERSPGALLTISGDVGQIPTGTRRIPFKVVVGEDSPLKPLFATIVLTIDGKTRIGSVSLDTKVTPKPEFPWWIVIVAGALVLLMLSATVVVVTRGRRRRSAEASDVRGLVATLWRESIELSSIAADSGLRPSARFEMYLDFDDDHPHLRSPDVGVVGERIVVTRTGPTLRVEVGEREAVETDLNASELIALRSKLSLRISRGSTDLDNDGPSSPAFGGYEPGGAWPPDGSDATTQPTGGAW